MTPLLPAPPEPGARTDLEALRAWGPLADLAGAEQDPRWHGEGDVMTHTLMVVEALVGDPAWQGLELALREELFWAALLHDVAKPLVTTVEDGRIRHPGHARRGAVVARGLLWRAGLDWRRRERICALVRHHMGPPRLVRAEDARREAIRMTLSCRGDLLAMLSRADTNGRIAPNTQDSLDALEFFEEYCAELECLAGPYPFATERSRVEYFRRPDRDPTWPAPDISRSRVTVLSGLPGAGKDRWCEKYADGADIVSLDAIRSEIGARATGDQGKVISLARERARQALRAGRPLVWNATNLSRDLRERVIELALAYDARVEIVVIEAGPDELLRQNAERADAVPVEAIERLLRRWEFPQPDEAHEIRVVSDERTRKTARAIRA